MRQRRNYPPPVYNQRRVAEAPIPVLQEIDIDAELLIQNQIDHRDVGEQNACDAAIGDAAIEHVVVAENDIDGAIENNQEIVIKVEAMDAPAFNEEEEEEELDILLRDETDPLAQQPETPNETGGLVPLPAHQVDDTADLILVQSDENQFIPMMEVAHTLVKREADSISGNIPFSTDVSIIQCPFANSNILVI